MSKEQKATEQKAKENNEVNVKADEGVLKLNEEDMKLNETEEKVKNISVFDILKNRKTGRQPEDDVDNSGLPALSLKEACTFPLREEYGRPVKTTTFQLIGNVIKGLFNRCFLVHMVWDDDAEKIAVPVRIAGKTYMFMVDTGAWSTYVEEDLLKELNARSPAVNYEFESTAANGGKFISRLYEVRMGLGKKILDMEVLSIKMNFLQVNGHRLAGVIGLGVLEKYGYIIDLKHKTLRCTL